MRLLLDTHALLWFVDGSTALSEHARIVIEDPDNDGAVSLVSYWEIAIKVHKGKLHLPLSPPELLWSKVVVRRCEVHWGNDGFCIDVAVQGLDTSDANPIGVLCDGARFDKAVDRVEWDLFRTAVLEGQGWEIHRISSPQIFRDLPETLQRIASASRRASTS